MAQCLKSVRYLNIRPQHVAEKLCISQTGITEYVHCSPQHTLHWKWWHRKQRVDERLSKASTVSAIHPHCMSTEGSDVDDGTPLSHLSHEPTKKNYRKKLTQVLCPIQYSMRAMDLNAKLSNFNVLWNEHMANHSGTSAPRYIWCPQYRGADKSLAWPTFRCILFDVKNISFDASLVLYI